MPKEYQNAPKALHRDRWPHWVSPNALMKDYHRHLKTSNWKFETPMNEGQLMTELRDRGFFVGEQTKRIRIVEWDENKGKKITRRPYIYGGLSYTRIASYLQEKFNFEAEGLPEDEEDEEGFEPYNDIEF